MRKNILNILFLFLIALSPISIVLLKSYLPEYSTHPTAYKFLFILPYFLCLLVAFLGLRLNQTRIFFSMLLFTLIYFLLSQIGSDWLTMLNQELFLKSLLVFFPLTLLLLFAFDEGALFGGPGLLRLLTVFLFFLICFLLAYMDGNFLKTAFIHQFLISWRHWRFPDLLWPILAFTILFFIKNFDKPLLPFKVALSVSTISLLIAMNRSLAILTPSTNLRIFNAATFALISFVFMYSIYKLYWEKVYIDELTGIPNRRAFNETLKKLGKTFSIAMLDIDFFKKFNDLYGHHEGDNVLRYVATHLKEYSNSRVFRYGGEEFAIIYPGSLVKEVFWKLDAVRESLAERTFYIRINETIRKKRTAKDRGRKNNGGKKVNVTISIGIANRSQRLRTTEDVIAAADKALYQAKKDGRNVVKKARS